jgi:predicted SAM-dependent methyltransferase
VSVGLPAARPWARPASAGVRSGNPFESARLRRVNRVARIGVSRVLRNRAWQARDARLRGREYLDIGCGPNPSPDFINLDYLWRPGIDLCWDLGHGLPLADGSLAGIFSEHCIEHVPLAVGDALLAECFRVLRPGGTIRLITPDAEQYLVGYAALRDDPAGASLPRAQQDRYRGEYTPAMSVNRVFGQFGHRFIYDFETFEVLLRCRGFVGIERSRYGASRDPQLLLDTERRVPGSLYVEATKPGEATAR